MHFGQSAFLALKEVIDGFYAEHPELANAGEDDLDRYVRLAVNAILVDILAGVINPFAEDDLELSLFALSKTAKIEGCDLKAYKLDWEDLVERIASYNAGGGEKVIAHMNSNHYIVVTEIDAESNVTYYEPNMGAEGESITVSKEEFLNIWEGYALSIRAPPEPEKRLTALQAQKIKGSGVFLIISVILSVVSFGLSFIDNKLCQILSKVLAIAAVVCSGLALLESLPQIFASFSKGLTFFKDIFTTGFAKIGDFFAKTMTGFVKANHNLSSVVNFLGTEVGRAIVTTAISIPTTITINRGLEFMGLDRRFARIAGSFLSTGLTMGLGNVGNIFSLGGAFQGLVFTGLQELGNVFEVPPEITNVVAISASTMIGAGFEAFENGYTDLAGNVFQKGTNDAALAAVGDSIGKVILPNIAGEMAYYGIQQLGSILGIDNRISSLAGIGIRSALRVGFSDGQDPGAIWNAAMTGLAQGVTSIGLDYVTQELNVDPLIANIGFSTIGALLQATFSANPEDDRNVMKKVYDTYVENALSMLGYNPAPNRYDEKYWELNGDGTSMIFKDSLYNSDMAQFHWQEAVHASQVQDFAQIVKEQGIEQALNTYALGLFNGIAVNTISQSAGILLSEFGTYFSNLIEQFKANPTSTNLVSEEILADGETVLKVDMVDKETDETILSVKFKDVIDDVVDEYFPLYGFEAEGFNGYGDWGVGADGTIGMQGGYYYKTYENIEIYTEIAKNANDVTTPKKVRIYDLETGKYTEVKASDSLEFQSYGVNLQDIDPGDYYPQGYTPTSDLYNFYEQYFTVDVGLGDYLDNPPEYTYCFFDGKPVAILEQSNIEFWDTNSLQVYDNGATIIKLLDENGKVKNIEFQLTKEIEIPIESIQLNTYFGDEISYVVNDDGSYKTVYRDGKLYVIANERFGEFQLHVPDRVSLFTQAATFEDIRDKIGELYEFGSDMYVKKITIHDEFYNRMEDREISLARVAEELDFYKSQLGVGVIDGVEHSSATRSFFVTNSSEDTLHTLTSNYKDSEGTYTLISSDDATQISPSRIKRKIEGQYFTLKDDGTEVPGIEFTGNQYSNEFTIGDGLDAKRFRVTYTLVKTEDGPDDDKKIAIVFKTKFESIDNGWGVENVTSDTFSVKDLEESDRNESLDSIRIKYNDGVLLDFDIEAALGYSNSVVKIGKPVIDTQLKSSYNEFREILMGR
ncbi:cysteine peptidase family C39 domain-containing protein [Candidatus Omnitrophota bacterium]